MKKLLTALTLLLIFVLPVSAQDDTTASPKPLRPFAEKRIEVRQEVKENREARIEERNTKREEFREKREAISDERKQALLKRIDAQMNKVNENMTNMWQRLIDRMQELAGKLQTRLDTLSGEGKNITAAQTALNEADAALITAENAVAAQKEKDYVIEFTDENGLRVGATTAKTALRADLKVVHDLIKDAREQLHEALLLAKQINETQ
jgi:hypothetical protein